MLQNMEKDRKRDAEVSSKKIAELEASQNRETSFNWALTYGVRDCLVFVKSIAIEHLPGCPCVSA